MKTVFADAFRRHRHRSSLAKAPGFLRVSSMHPTKIFLIAGIALLAVRAVVASPFQVWHPRSPTPTDKNLNSVTYANGRFVAVGNEGTIVTSTNGLDWSLVASGVINQLNTVGFGAGRFVIGGNTGLILCSIDGLNWTNAAVP